MSKRQASKTKAFVFQGFENLTFEPGEQAALTKWIDALEDTLEDSIVVLVEGGYKVGVGYDDYDGVYAVAATCKDRQSRYYGWCFTLKHSDVGKGISVLRRFYEQHLKEELYEVGKRSNKHDW